MSRTARLSGAKPLVYIDGTELVSCRGYSVDVAHDTQEAGAFGEIWKTILGGQLSASGSLDCWLEHDQKILLTASVKGLCNSVNVMIYPNRADIADVIYFDAYFGTGFAGDTGSVQSNPASFNVKYDVQATAFAP